MSSSSVPSVQVTAADKARLVPIILGTLASMTFRAIAYPFIGGPKAKTYLKDVIYAALRTNLSAHTVGSEQAFNALLNGSTEDAYLKLAKGHNFQPDTDVLADGLKAHWIGPKSAKKMLLYFHGGGYVLAASDGHLEWLYSLQQDLSKDGVSVVLISYTLAPKATYPSQLQEAAESLRWLLEDQQKKPSDIFIAGDSAGGNMTLMLLSHMLHPHPDVSSKININEPLAGAILISPWTKFGTDDDSVRRNQTSDMVTPTAATRWSTLFLGGKQIDNWNQPILVDDSWFKDLESKVKDIVVWGGGGEVLIDSIELSTKKLQKAHPRVEYVVEPGAAHEDFIFSKFLGYKGKEEGTELIENWIKARL